MYMNKKINRLYTLLLVCLIVIFGITGLGQPIASVLAAPSDKPTTTYAGDMKTGSYISFGTYNKEPILWLVIGKNEFGDPLLFAENILTYKAFDDQLWMANTDKNYGNNYWLNSDLRAWLNGEDESVKFDSNGGPTAGKVKDGYNAYADEPGFLYNFTQDEISSIVMTRHRQLIDEVNSTAKIIVNPTAKLHTYIPQIENSLGNYAEARYLLAEEKVFLLDINEFYSMVYKAGYNVTKSPTLKAMQLAEHKFTAGLSPFWLRTPRATYAEETADPKYNGASAKPDGASVRVVYNNNYILAKDAYDGSVGVVPALHLNKNTVLIHGKGTIASPFRTDGKMVGVDIADRYLAMLEGESTELKYEVNGLSSNEVIWKVLDNNKVVSINSKGELSALKIGEVKVQATSTSDSSKSDIVIIQVYENLPSHIPAVVNPSVGNLNASNGNTVSEVFTIQADPNAEIIDVTLTAAGTVFALKDLTISADKKSATFKLSLLDGKKLQDKEPYKAAVTVKNTGKFVGETKDKQMIDPVDVINFDLNVIHLSDQPLTQ